MPAEKATAIVLRTIDFSETSLVVSLFTREFGKIQGLAKGGRRLKGPFESALDLLALCRIVFLRKSSDALDLLTEAKLLRRFRPAGRSLSSLYAGYYVAELLNELTDQYDPHPQLFDLADEALCNLSAGASGGGVSEKAVQGEEGKEGRAVLRFELGALRELGHLPTLSVCADCGAAVSITGRVAFGQLDGGVLCGRCRTGKKQVASVTAGAIRAMDSLADPAGRAAGRIRIDERTYGEVRGVLNHYLVNLLGRKPRMHQYLGFG